MAFLLTLTAGSAFATVRYVGNCGGTPQYTTIQAAVLACNPYDTIIVCPGTYTENVLVDFSGNTTGVTIMSTEVQEPDLTVVQGGFTIVSSYVTIKGFKITGGNSQGIGVEISGDYATVAFNHIVDCWGGIRINQTVPVFSSDGNTIHHNKIEDNDAWGINVEGKDNLIHHNEILNTGDQNYTGIQLQSQSNEGNIHHNKLKDNAPYGIKVEGDNYHIHQNQICDGVFLQNNASDLFLHHNIVKKPPGIINNGAQKVKLLQNSTPSDCPF